MRSREPAAGDPVASTEAAAWFADLAQVPALVLAVSGGPDSTALLVLAARWRAGLKDGPKLLAVTIDHGLRPEAAAEAKAVKRLARELGVAHRIVRWIGRKPATGVQAAARAARYRLLADAARKAGARHILTAHTLDDQAETILFRLARGSGLAGLAGMARVSPLPGGRERDIVLVRPFLGVAKQRLVATLQAAGIPYARDPSNADPRFARPRLRRLMPALAGEGLDAGRLALLGRRAARAEATIESAVGEALSRVSPTQWSKSGPIMLEKKAFGDLPAEVALRVLGRAVAFAGDEGPVELGKLEALFQAVGSHAPEEGRGRRLRRTLAGAVVTVASDRLTVERAPARRQRGQPASQRLSRRRVLY